MGTVGIRCDGWSSRETDVKAVCGFFFFLVCFERDSTVSCVAL